MTGPTRNLEFAAVLDEIADGRSNRELSRITREAGHYVSHSTISDARWGTVPSYRVLERLVLGLSVGEALAEKLFRAAGYVRQQESVVPADEALNAGDAIIDGWRELCEEFPEQEIPFPQFQGGIRGLTLEKVTSILAGIRSMAQRGVYPKR